MWWEAGGGRHDVDLEDTGLVVCVLVSITGRRQCGERRRVSTTARSQDRHSRLPPNSTTSSKWQRPDAAGWRGCLTPPRGGDGGVAASAGVARSFDELVTCTAQREIDECLRLAAAAPALP